MLALIILEFHGIGLKIVVLILDKFLNVIIPNSSSNSISLFGALM